MIIVDFSGIFHANITAMDLPAEEGILRHTTLNSLRATYVKFKDEYGPEMVIACDSGSWRRDYYPEYKARRRAARNEDPADQAYWEEVFRIQKVILDEIREFLPWKVVGVSKAEADDVVAVLTKSTTEFGKMQDVMIVGADSDYKQLLRYSNVSQYSNATKKMVKVDNPVEWLHEAIMTGQKGKDDIPNIRMPNDFFVSSKGGKQLPITKKILAESWDNRSEIHKYLSEQECAGYTRNRTLIDFDYIPSEIESSILQCYADQEETDPQKVLSYLITKKCGQLAMKQQDFFP